MILWWIKSKKEQHLFKIEIFSNNIRLYYHFNTFLLNKSIIFCHPNFFSLIPNCWTTLYIVYCTLYNYIVYSMLYACVCRTDTATSQHSNAHIINQSTWETVVGEHLKNVTRKSILVCICSTQAVVQLYTHNFCAASALLAHPVWNRRKRAPVMQGIIIFVFRTWGHAWLMWFVHVWGACAFCFSRKKLWYLRIHATHTVCCVCGREARVFSSRGSWMCSLRLFLCK